MENFIPGLIMAFREGLEAFLIIVILLKFLEKTDKNLKKQVWTGLVTGILVSIIFGAFLMSISSFFGGTSATGKLWESIASFVAVILITTFIVWMINHGSKIRLHVEGKAALNLSKQGIFLIALLMIAREGVEIVLFQFAGKYPSFSVFTGILISAVFAFLIYHSLIKIKLETIFKITLAYLILQAGFLAGYSVHEGLSASKELRFIASENPVFTKVFDLSETTLNHKEGFVGIPLYVGIGWYSKPEWIQFIIQYLVTGFLFLYWYKRKKN